MNTICFLTVWRRKEDRTDCRTWFWTSTPEKCLEKFSKSTDFCMESGYYTHIILEVYKEGYIASESEKWFSVEYDKASDTYSEPKECESQDKNTISWAIG